MPTIVATAGATNANSYATLTEANTYHDTHLYASVWTDAEDDNKIIALIWATRLLDQVCTWDGAKVTQGQALRWPRSWVYDQDGYVFPNDAIPQWLKNVAAELARHLLTKDRLQAMEDAIAGLKSVQAGSVSVEFDSMDRISALPISVQQMLEPYAKTSSGGFQVPVVRT